MNNWVAPRLTDGLGNRLFQLAAAMHIATKHNRPLRFYIPRIQPSVHDDCSVIFSLFPDISKIWSTAQFETLKEDPAKFTQYTDFSLPSDPVILEGYFQCAKYLEGITLTPDWNFVTDVERNRVPNAESTWWIHIRLGDYLKLPHHQCTTEEYWRAALARVPLGAQVLVFSDEPAKALQFLQGLGIRHCNFVLQDVSAMETLYRMSQCGGGCIGSNSTFSWWGQYFSLARKKGAPCILPRQWHKDVKEENTDVFGSWHTVL